MAVPEEKVLRIRLDTQQAERDISNLATRVSNTMDSKLARYAGAVAFGLAGYGVYRMATSPTGESIGSAAHALTTGTRDVLGFSPSGVRVQNQDLVYSNWATALMGLPQDYTGRNLMQATAGYYGMRDFGQRVSAGLTGFISGTGLTMGVIGAGALFNRIGIGQSVVQAFQGLGAGLGGGVLGTATGLAGRAIAAPLRWAGFGGAAEAVTGITSRSGFLGSGAATLGRGIGGFFGATVPFTLATYGAARFGEEIAMNVATQRQIQDAMDQIGYRYTYGDATNLATGRGFDLSDQIRVAETVRSILTEREFLRQTDFRDIFRGIVESDLDFNVRSAEEFARKFEKVTDVILDIARMYETTLEGATELLGTMQRSGFYTTADQASALLRMNALARNAGMLPGQMVTIAQTGADQARAMGFEGSVGADLATSIATYMNLRASYLDPADRTVFEQRIQELGGSEAVSTQLSNFFLSTMRGPHGENTTLALYGLFDDDGELNRERLSRFISGDLGMIELMGYGDARRAQNQGAFEAYLAEKDLYLGRLSGSEVLEFFRASVENIQRQQYGTEDIRTVLRALGMDNQLLQSVTSMGLFGSPMRSEALMEIEEVQRLLASEDALYRTPKGWWERYVANPLTSLGYQASQPFVRMGDSISEWLENFYYDKILRVDRLDVAPEDMSLESVLAAARVMDYGRIFDAVSGDDPFAAIDGLNALRIQGRVYGDTSVTRMAGDMLGTFLPSQEVTLRSVDQLSDIFSTHGYDQGVGEIAAIRDELQKLFKQFEDGSISTRQFADGYSALVGSIKRLTDEAVAGSDRLGVAAGEIAAAIGALPEVMDAASLSTRIDQLRSDMVQAIGGEAAMSSATVLTQALDRYAFSQSMMGVLARDRSLTPDAQRVLDAIVAQGGTITSQSLFTAMNQTGVQGMSRHQQSAILEHLEEMARAEGSGLYIRNDPYLDTLRYLSGTLSNLGADQDVRVNEAISRALFRVAPEADRLLRQINQELGGAVDLSNLDLASMYELQGNQEFANLLRRGSVSEIRQFSESRGRLPFVDRIADLIEAGMSQGQRYQLSSEFSTDSRGYRARRDDFVSELIESVGSMGLAQSDLAQDVLRDFFDRRDASGYRVSNYHFGNLQDLMERYGITDADTAEIIRGLAGQGVGAMVNLGLISESDLSTDFSFSGPAREVFERAIDDWARALDANLDSNLIKRFEYGRGGAGGFGTWVGSMSLEDIRGAIRDSEFRRAVQTALSGHRYDDVLGEVVYDRNVVDRARAMLGEDENMIKLFNFILSDVRSGRENALEEQWSLMRELDILDMVEGRAGVSDVMRDRWRSLAIRLGAEQDMVKEQYRPYFENAERAINQFLDESGDFSSGLSILYSDDVIFSLRHSNLNVAASALEWGKRYEEMLLASGGDSELIKAAQQQIMRSMIDSGFFSEDAQEYLSSELGQAMDGAQSTESFRRILESAIRSVLEQQTMVPGTQTLYGQSSEALASMFDRQITHNNATMIQVSDSVTELDSTLKLLNSRLDDLETLIRTRIPQNTTGQVGL